MRSLSFRLLLAATCAAAASNAANAGCTISVSHNDDPALAGNATGDRNNKLTLREAVAIADGNLRCYTDFEKARVAGGNFVHDPVLCASVDNTINWRLSASSSGCGPSDQDTIRFDDGIVGGSVVSVLNGPLALDPLDGIEGEPATVGARPDITLRGPGAGSSVQPGGVLISSNFALNPASGTFKNLRFEEFRGFGLLAQWVRGAKVFNVSFSRIYTDAFGRADGLVFGDGQAGDCVDDIEVGGTGANQHNWFFGLAGSGLLIADGCPNASGDRNNKVFNNFFGMCEELDTGFGADGCASGTSNQQLGGAGVRVLGSSGVRIGGAGPGERNWFGRAGLAGVYIAGSSAHGNYVRGNWVGLAATQITRANDRGVMVVSGAYGNTIGGTSAAEGNVVSGNANHGIYVTSGDANDVSFNVVGLSPARTQVRGNGQDGIAVNSTATNVRIRDNVVAGNALWGIFLGASSGGVLERNVIGLRGSSNNANDNTATPNGSGGIWVLEGANNAIALGNRIAGNGGPGVRISGDGADGTIVRGNVIGLDNGNSLRANAGHGVWVESGPDATTIGGSAAARNTISGNAGSGVRIDGPGSDATIVDLNRIGTLPGGSGDAGNAGDGVTIGAGATNALVQNNFIAGNDGDGVRIDGNVAAAGSGAIVRLNLLGVDGAPPVGNGGAGVSLRNGTTNATIGGSAAQGNGIQFNGGDGVWIESGTNDLVAGNGIVANGGLGIDLGADGIAANDAGDGDTGANGLQNFPTIANVVRGGGMVSMSLALASAPAASYVLEAFRNIACDPSGNGEAEASLGTVSLATGAGGSGTVLALFPLADATAATLFTAAASGGRNTSELSPCASLAAPPVALFANGFETGPVAATASPERVGANGARRIARDRAVLTLALPLGAARSLVVTTNHAVTVESIDARGMACAVQGALLCEDTGSGASLAVVFGADATQVLSIGVESRDAAGALQQSWYDVPPADD